MIGRQLSDFSKSCAVSVLQVKTGPAFTLALNRKKLSLRFLRMEFGIGRPNRSSG